MKSIIFSLGVIAIVLNGCGGGGSSSSNNDSSQTDTNNNTSTSSEETSSSNFTRENEIVTDYLTGLQWQDNSDAKTLVMNRGDAIDYCKDLTLGGYSDWRLPEKDELKSIVDENESPILIYNIFKNKRAWNYWTSYSVSLSLGKTVSFSTGKYENARINNQYYVRCLRNP